GDCDGGCRVGVPVGGDGEAPPSDLVWRVFGFEAGAGLAGGLFFTCPQCFGFGGFESFGSAHLWGRSAAAAASQSPPAPQVFLPLSCQTSGVWVPPSASQMMAPAPGREWWLQSST